MYMRVSTEDQRLGIEAQRAAVRRWARREGVVLAAEYSEDVSGGAPLDRRPQLEAAIAALEAHGAGLLLVHKRDRLARDVMAAVMVDRLVERAGARVVTADGTANDDAPEAALQRGLMDLFAQYERAIIRSRTRAALAAKKARGELVGAAPFGQRVAADGVRLEPHAGEAAAVARVAYLRAGGMSLREIVRQLEADGFRGRTGRPLALTQVARLARRTEER